MTKRQKLEELDRMVIDQMMKSLAAGNTDELRDLNVAVTYLKNNQVITPPEKDKGMHDKIKDAIK